MLARKPLKSQFAAAFGLILIASIMATMATYFAGYLIFLNLEYKKIYPANHYEKIMPVVEEELRKKGTGVLNPEAAEELEEIIPAEGIAYQVMDASGNKIYGTDNRRIITNKEAFYRKINTSTGADGKFTRLIPVIDESGKLAGGVALTYAIAPYFPNSADRVWIKPLFIAILFSPFLYITIFTLLFSKKMAGNIVKPVNLLIDAARKVKEKNLDFHIDYDAENELGKLCEAFNDMKNELKTSLLSQWRIEQERREMVAALAHDLKTPLTAIMVCAESLLEGNFGREKTETYLHVIRENANKSTERVKDMLYAAELEFSGAVPEAAPVDLESFFRRKKEDYELLAERKKIRIEAGVRDQRRDRKECPLDEAKLERILDNIVSNSIRHTPEHGKIAIRADVARDHIRFTVCDSGPGFSRKDLSRLFDKFYRGDEARSSKDGHAGLGLYIAKKLIELHGGKVEAHNAQGGGACIKFDLRFLKSGRQGRLDPRP